MCNKQRELDDGYISHSVLCLARVTVLTVQPTAEAGPALAGWSDRCGAVTPGGKQGRGGQLPLPSTPFQWAAALFYLFMYLF